MYAVLKSSHSYLAWIALLLIIIAIVISGISFLKKSNFEKSNFKIALFALIAIHVQLLVGLILYFVSPNGFSNVSGATMKDSFSRLLAVEHPFINILAIIIITIGYSKAKKLIPSSNSGKVVFIYYGIGLILLLSRIPWNSWLG